jgi:hypothetical protein
MDVKFFSEDARRKSRQLLDRIMKHGVDQLAIACAFCSGAGVEVLLQHAKRLQNPGSFVVVSSDPPTNYEALSRLHQMIPGHLFVHWGSQSPHELKVGAALMHSKVFYARSGQECWLWTGSHNLTANATQGSNCEAAILLHGDAAETPFVDALKHLTACKNEAAVYDPDTSLKTRALRAELIAIHAESEGIPKVPMPWHVQLSVDSPDFDRLLSPPTDVRLFLYPLGSLCRGWQSIMPRAAFSGRLTGLNLTSRNPRASQTGTTAAWTSTDFGISESRGVLIVGPSRPPGPSVMTQFVMHFDSTCDAHEPLFSEEPKMESQMTTAPAQLTDVDTEMRCFYSKKSLSGFKLVNIRNTGRHRVLKLIEEDTRTGDIERISMKFGHKMAIPIEMGAPSALQPEKQHPLIVRVKYRLGKH